MALNSNFRTLTADNIEGIVEDRNYLKSSFENGTITGWTEVSVALTSGLPTGTPTIGSSAASSLALSATSVTPLSGSRSLLVDVPSALTAGHGFISDEFTLDRMDLGKVLTVSFDYERVSGTYNFSGTLGSQTWMVYIYDATLGAANWIQPAGFLGMNQSSGPGRVRATFQSSVTAGQKYRVAVIASQAAAGASSLEFDNFTCSRQTAPIGPVVTDWVSYTPTWTGLTVGNANQKFFYRRNGDSVEIKGNIQFGSTTSVSGKVTFTLPTGLSLDNSKNPYPLTAGGYARLGTASVYDGGVKSVLMVIQDFASLNTFYFVGKDGTTVIDPLNNTSYGWGTNDEIEVIELTVPISGWSSNVQLSNDTDTRVVAFRATRTSSQSFPNVPALPGTVVQFDSIKNDTHGAWDSVNYRYIIPVSGYYDISARFLLQFGTNTAEIVAYLVVDGTVVALQQDFKAATASGNQGIFARFLWNLNAGQAVQVRMYQANSGGGAINGVFELGGIEHGAMYVNRLSGPSVVAASETVAMRAVSATTAVGTSATTVVFSIKEYDTHNIYSTSTGAMTIPVSGKYSVKAITESPSGASCSVANGGTYLMLFKGVPGSGAIHTLLSNLRWPLVTSTGMPVILTGGTTFHANAGDVFYIVQQRDSSISAYSLSGTSFVNVLVVERVGN